MARAPGERKTSPACLPGAQLGMNGMKMMTIRAAVMAAAGAVLVSLAAGAAVAVEITVFRGGETTVVDTNAPHKGPHVLRGGMTTKAPAKPRAATRQTVILTPVMAGAGSTVWYRTDDGLMACTLRGTGYVGGQKRISCVRR